MIGWSHPFHHLIDETDRISFFDFLRKSVFNKQILVMLQLKNVEDLFEGHIDIVTAAGMVLGSTWGQGSFLAGVSFDGGSGLLDHIVVDSLALFLLPMMHLIILFLYKFTLNMNSYNKNAG